MADVARFSLNTATGRKQAPLGGIIEACARAGVRAIDPWRDQVKTAGLETVARHLRHAGIKLSGYCRGGFFTANDKAGLIAALADNRQAIDEAKALGSPCVVLVVGSLPGALAGPPQSHDLSLARAQVFDGIAATLEYARTVGMALAIEPLHPMQAADRACVNTLEQALDICDALEPAATGALGVALDAYHVWWDPKLAGQIARAGSNRLLGYHVCDWLQPTKDLLNDRGMMGDGVIELGKLSALVESAGYRGPIEVELFSERWWAEPIDRVIATCLERFATAV